jgi:hypothetical protein|tara:strand:- start:141 stop:383 length:243 start_codon:yes stop_codon:yes gene_type:complete
MERQLETMFDTVNINTGAVLLDSTELKNMLVEQRKITMTRVASWLRSNSKIFELNWETNMAKELKELAADLDHLTTIEYD